MMLLDFLDRILSVLWMLIKIGLSTVVVMFILAVFMELRKRLKDERGNDHD